MNAVKVQPDPIFNDRALRIAKMVHWPQQFDLGRPPGLNARQHPVDLSGGLLCRFPRHRRALGSGAWGSGPWSKRGRLIEQLACTGSPMIMMRWPRSTNFSSVFSMANCSFANESAAGKVPAGDNSKSIAPSLYNLHFCT